MVLSASVLIRLPASGFHGWFIIRQTTQNGLYFSWPQPMWG